MSKETNPVVIRKLNETQLNILTGTEGVCGSIGTRCLHGRCSTNSTCGTDEFFVDNACGATGNGTRSCYCCK